MKDILDSILTITLATLIFLGYFVFIGIAISLMLAVPAFFVWLIFF